MLPDYYAILGVQPDADLEAIRLAYKRRTFESHPDRGGSHEQMVRIIAAWEVLSDPIARQHYDNARSRSQDPVAQAAANEDSRKAHEQAEHYPRQWSDFEAWIEGVTNDFAKAEYTEVGGIYGTKWPVIIGSESGRLFVLIGGILGLLVGLFCFYLYKTKPLPEIPKTITEVLNREAPRRLGPRLPFFQNWYGFHFWYLGVCSVMGASAGATLGAQAHKGIGIVLKRRVRRTNLTAIVRCSQCGQQLRVPNSNGKWQIKCPKCRHSFTHVAE